MWLSYLRICGALGVTLLSGTYYFIQLRGTCDHTPYSECIFKGPRPLTEPKAKPPEQTTKSPKPTDKAAARGKKAPKVDEPAKVSPPLAGKAVKWSRTTASEELLIWSGHLDGEVGRIAPADFDKAVTDYQAILPPGISTEDQQIATLQKRVAVIRSRWGFDKEDDPNAAELSLAHKLLPSRQELGHGSRYQSSAGDFVVDVAEWTTAETSIDKSKDFHCCKISPARKLEGTIADTSDASGPGFILSAREGPRRVSVRAHQRDGVIRILAIDYDTAKDKEYRVLRNAIASSYVAFAPARKRGEERVYDSCQRVDGERCGADKPASQPAPWGNGHAPL